ncbi:MAG: MerR family transcriptional regulator [Actinobacteria bacterium]|nr:MAG: MerR family transcriptional regulator [Actinomycetota bacterium]
MKKEIPEKNYLIISKVVKKLKKLYPDLTNSKLRFLESEGLLSPKRALNRYRIYYREDIEKLNYILKMQKDFYMPLEVIKEKLKSKEFKKFISECESIETLQLKLGEEFKLGYELKLYSIDDISKKFKLSQSFIIDLHENEIIDWSEENGKYVISTYDIEILELTSKLSKYGIQVRHLKLFENFAGRHSSFIQQIIYPLLMSSKKDSHIKAARVANKLERILCDFQELLIKKENRKFLEKYK